MTLHDTEYLRRKYISEKTALIFFNNGKHNDLLAYMYTDIRLAFIDIYIKSFYYKITLNRSDSFIYFEFYKSLLTFFFPRKKILTIEEYMKEQTNKRNISYKDFAIEKKLYNKKIQRPAIKLTDKYTKIVEKKIKKYFESNYSIMNESFCFYLRYKGMNSFNKEERDEFNRSSSSFEDYKKTFNYLSDLNYKIFIYGDYDYIKNKNYIQKTNIICSENLKIDSNLFCIYAAHKCDYFIGSSGGGVQFPISRKDPPPLLILNALPYDDALTNATFSYKNVRNSEGNLLSAKTLLNQYSEEYEIEGCITEFHDENLILEIVKEFIDYHTKTKKYEKTNFLTSNSILNRHNVRVSPVWINSNTKGDY
tara:strand:- start:46069 stop:47160 length:1092 start_codon:yes stop_codon:yes gene_type:complete